MLQDLHGDGSVRDRIITAVDWLLAKAHLRIGNQFDADTNEIYGATRLLTDHPDNSMRKVTQGGTTIAINRHKRKTTLYFACQGLTQ